MVKPEKKTEVRVFNRETGNVKRIIRTDTHLNRKEKMALDATIKKAKVKNATPEHILDITNEAEREAALRTLVGPKSMLDYRIRQLKRRGYSNVAVGKVLKIHESTVRRHLKNPITPIEALLDDILHDLELAREEVLANLVSNPQFEKVFGEGMGEKFILSIHTNQRNVEISPKFKRVKFTLEFIATAKDIK